MSYLRRRFFKIYIILFSKYRSHEFSRGESEKLKEKFQNSKVKSLSSELINIGKINIENIKSKSNPKVKKIRSFNSLKPKRQHEQHKPFLSPNTHSRKFNDAENRFSKVRNKSKKNNLIPPWEISTTKYNPLHVNDASNNENKNYHIHLNDNVIRKVKSDLNLKSSKNSILSDITYSASFLILNKERSYNKNKDQTSEILTSTRLVEKEDQIRAKNRQIKKINPSNRPIRHKTDSNTKKKTFSSLSRPKVNQPLSRRASSLGKNNR